MVKKHGFSTLVDQAAQVPILADICYLHDPQSFSEPISPCYTGRQLFYSTALNIKQTEQYSTAVNIKQTETGSMLHTKQVLNNSHVLPIPLAELASLKIDSSHQLLLQECFQMTGCNPVVWVATMTSEINSVISIILMGETEWNWEKQSAS